MPILDHHAGPEGEADIRHHFHVDDQYHHNKRRLLMFVAIAIFLPIVDFITDIQMVITFGVPLLVGYDVCTVQRSNDQVEKVQFAASPGWSINDEICGYIDNRVDKIQLKTTNTGGQDWPTVYGGKKQSQTNPKVKT